MSVVSHPYVLSGNTADQKFDFTKPGPIYIKLSYLSNTCPVLEKIFFYKFFEQMKLRLCSTQ